MKKISKEIREYHSKLGKKGGPIGGKARMASMTVKQRKEFAMMGVEARRKNKIQKG